MLVNPCLEADFAISRPPLSGYAAVSSAGFTVEAYRSAAGQMRSVGAMHRISINRTAHRRYAFTLDDDGVSRSVDRAAYSLGFQPAGRALTVDGDGADYISIFQDPALYRSLAGGGFMPEALDAPRLLVPTDAVTRHLACAIAETARHPGTTDTMLAEQLGIAFALSTMQLFAGAPGRPRRPAHALSEMRLRRVTDYVEEKLGESGLSIAELAGIANLSAFHFSRAFRRSTGRSPHQFVLERRIERARALLADRSSSLATIAVEVGFSSQSHFSTAFRRATGLTPQGYRDQT